jgi:FkbM family methyltransferase
VTAVTWLKNLVRAALARLGYTVHRIPPRAGDPTNEIEVDFDYVLAHYLANRDDSTPLLFLQVGAFDGVADDPVNVHVRRRGWHGILVEPQPAAFERLVANYSDTGGLTFVNAAIAPEQGTRQLYVIRDEAGELVEALGGIASFDRAHLERFMRTDGPRYPGIQIGSLEVRCTTFEDVLSDVPQLDLLLIDTEGYDLELLDLFDFDRFRPAIVRFEHVHLSRASWDEAVELLARRGYRTLREEYDTTAYLEPQSTGRGSASQ